MDLTGHIPYTSSEVINKFWLDIIVMVKRKIQNHLKTEKVEKSPRNGNS